MNVSDTERVSSKLLREGFAIVSREEEADVLLLNTCAIREKAVHKIFTRVGEIRQKHSSKQPLIGLMGCVAQLEGATLFEKSQAVSIVGGTGAIDRLPEIIERAIDKKGRHLDMGESVGETDWDIEPEVRHSRYVAFVSIIEGCNKFCTYCIVPYSRGRERSRNAKSIIEEINRLKADGVKEVCLIGQNVNSYRPLTEEGLEGIKGATPFSRLLRAVAATGMERIKFTTSFPRDFHEDIVISIEEHSNLCEWVHLPVQSGSDNVLKAMKRGYTARFYLNLVERLHKSTRNISLTTDIIVGFPNESDNDHRETLQLVEKCEFDGAYIFKYSERQGTPAQIMGDTIDERLKTERFLEVESLQKKIQQRKYSDCVGKEMDVLVEKESVRGSGQVSGHSTCQKVVNLQGDSSLLGSILRVRIEEAKVNSLIGAIV